MFEMEKNNNDEKELRSIIKIHVIRKRKRETEEASDKEKRNSVFDEFIKIMQLKLGRRRLKIRYRMKKLKKTNEKETMNDEFHS